MLEEPAMMSAPVDLDQPGFASLLSALEAVHTGGMPVDVLARYHDVLSTQVADSALAIKALSVPDELDDLERQLAEAQRSAALSSLTMLEAMLERLGAYIEAPSPEGMAICVQLFLQAEQMFDGVERWLDTFAGEEGTFEELDLEQQEPT